MLLSFYKLGFAVIGLGWLLTAPAGAYTEEDLTIYAMLYPDLFVSQTQTVSAAPNRGVIVPLLLRSFNEATDVEALTAVLSPQDRGFMKSETEIQQLVEARGLRWDTYREITHDLATQPLTLSEFMKIVDGDRVKNQVLSRLQAGRVQDVPDLDHQAILTHLQAYRPQLKNQAPADAISVLNLMRPN